MLSNYLSITLEVYLCIYLSIYLYNYLSIHLPTVNLSRNMSNYKEYHVDSSSQIQIQNFLHLQFL